MPRVGWFINGERVSHEDALLKASLAGSYFRFPPAVWEALHRVTQRVDGWWLSPSQAGGCPRRYLLQITEPYWLDPEKAWPLLIGHAMHHIFTSPAGDQHEEQYLTMPLQVPILLPGGEERVVEFPLQGTLDKYEPLRHRLTDYKSTDDFSYRNKQGKLVYKRYPDGKHAFQANLYRMLLEQHGYPVNHIQIFYFQPRKNAPRKVVDVPLGDLEETYAQAVVAAAPLALTRETGQLPACTCPEHLRGWGMDRDLCASVRDEDWRGLPA